jgi:hypothetical protein
MLTQCRVLNRFPHSSQTKGLSWNINKTFLAPNATVPWMRFEHSLRKQILPFQWKKTSKITGKKSLKAGIFVYISDAGIESRTVAILAMAVRRSYHSARSHSLSTKIAPDIKMLDNRYLPISLYLLVRLSVDLLIRSDTIRD